MKPTSTKASGAEPVASSDAPNRAEAHGATDETTPLGEAERHPPSSQAPSTRRPRKRSGADDEPVIALFGVAMSRVEFQRTALFFALMFLVALIFVVGRTARDALFLTQFSVTWIAPMWMAYGLASSLVALGYARYVDRLSRARFVGAFSCCGALAFVALRVLIGEEIRAAYAVLYVVAEIIANLAAMSAWTLAQDLYDARSGKRLFGLVGAGRVVGTIACGFGTGVAVERLGTSNLLIVLAAALASFGLLSIWILRRHGLGAPPAQRAFDAGRDRGPIGNPGYVVRVAAMILLLFAILTVGDYQFKAIAQTSYPTRDALARFMANFYGVVGAVGLVIQLGVTPRLLQRYGVAVIVVMPLAFSGSTLGLLLVPGVAFATVLKASDNGLQFTIHEATMQLLLFPFRAAARSRVRTLVEAVVKPLGCGVGALALILLAPSMRAAAPGPDLVHSAARLGFFTLPVGLVIVGIAPFVRRGYLEAMRRTLVRRDIEPAAVERSPHLRAMLREALHGADAPQVLYAVEQLRPLDSAALRDALPSLVAHRSGRVRALGLRLAAELDDDRAAGFARAALADPVRAVRVAAVQALAERLREDAHDELSRLADGQDEAVRAAAIASLVRACGLDGMLDGAPRLRALIDAEDPDDRIAAANILGMVGEASLQRALSRLLVDPDPRVRRAAVEAASKVGDARLLPPVLDALADRVLAPAAARALAAMGPDAVPLLSARLADATTPRRSRLAIPRILAKVATRAALEALLARLDERDEVVRQKVLASASRLRLAIAAPPLPFSAVRSRIDAEMAEFSAVREGYVVVRPLVARPLLDEHVSRRLRKGLIRILRLCELAFPREVVASVRTHVFGADAVLRANAFEVLESLLDRRLREQLVGFVESVNRLQTGHFPPPPLEPREGHAAVWLGEEIARGEPYAAALALESIAHHRIPSGGAEATQALRHPDPLVREAAALAVAATRPAGYVAALSALLDDPDPTVRAVARAGRDGVRIEELMYTTIEKVLFLQRVPLFARVSGDDLASLAHGAAVVSLRKNEVVFRQGEPGGALYLVMSGRVTLTVEGRVVADLGPSDVFGEMSIFDDEPRASTAMAVEEAELLRVSADDFHDAVRDTVEIAEAVIQVLNRRLREADRRLAAARAGPQAGAAGDAEDGD